MSTSDTSLRHHILMVASAATKFVDKWLNTLLSYEIDSLDSLKLVFGGDDGRVYLFQEKDKFSRLLYKVIIELAHGCSITEFESPTATLLSSNSATGGNGSATITSKLTTGTTISATAIAVETDVAATTTNARDTVRRKKAVCFAADQGEALGICGPGVCFKTRDDAESHVLPFMHKTKDKRPTAYSATFKRLSGSSKWGKAWMKSGKYYTEEKHVTVKLLYHIL
jgi:hypothetical protein